MDIIPADERCQFCKRKKATLLCDFPEDEIVTSLDFKPIRLTCDCKICEDCATHIAENTDFCPKCMDFVRNLKTGKEGK